MDHRPHYHDALVKLDELSLMLGEVLRCTRIGWDDDTVTCEDVLGPINEIAKQIGEAIPLSIKITRPRYKYEQEQSE